MNLTPEELNELQVYRDAIDLIFDNGKWQRVRGDLVWVIPEEYADKVQQMIGDLDE